MGQSTWDQFLARNIWIDVHCLRTTMKFLIVLAFFSAVAIAEETNVAEVTDQQVEAARYGGYGHGYRYGRSVVLTLRDRQATTEDITVMDMVIATVALLLLILRDRQANTVDITVMDMVIATVAPLVLTLRDRQATTVDITVMDMVIDTVALLLLILRDKKATTVDTTVMDTVTVMAALLLLILRDKKVIMADTTPDIVATIMDTTNTELIFLKLSIGFHFQFWNYTMIDLRKLACN